MKILWHKNLARSNHAHIVLLGIVVTSLGIDLCSNLRFCKRRWPSSSLFMRIFKKNQTLLFFWNRRSLTRARCSSLSSSIDLISRKIIALTISILSRGLTRHNSHHSNVLICLVCQYRRECTKKNNSNQIFCDQILILSRCNTKQYICCRWRLVPRRSILLLIS